MESSIPMFDLLNYNGMYTVHEQIHLLEMRGNLASEGARLSFTKLVISLIEILSGDLLMIKLFAGFGCSCYILLKVSLVIYSV